MNGALEVTAGRIGTSDDADAGTLDCLESQQKLADTGLLRDRVTFKPLAWARPIPSTVAKHR